MRALGYKRERWTDRKEEATYGGGTKHQPPGRRKFD